MKRINKKVVEGSAAGSALILTVVLTSLLAIIGILFVMAANVDRLSTSAVTTNKELQFAVDSVVAEISQQLALDVPGVANQEYYDYPGDSDPWLASLEPNGDPATNPDFRWKQISDVDGYLKNHGYTTQDIDVPLADSSIIDEHKQAVLGQLADADGDGVPDFEMDGASQHYFRQRQTYLCGNSHYRQRRNAERQYRVLLRPCTDGREN